MRTAFAILFIIPLICCSQKNGISLKTFTLQGNTCSGFQTSGGSLIFIPDNAFKSDDGGACLGVITIKYREFHSQTDMYYAGLNMIWDDNGKYRLLESVGMFEIEAWCSGKRLLLGDGKSIQVRMKCRRNLENLHSFIYNTSKNTWSKYPAEVIDFSFFRDRNKADSSTVWGSGGFGTADSTMTTLYDSLGNEYYVKGLGAGRPILPEGFFKGININTLGIFNYDAVIKDSLAVPMEPELFVGNEKTTALEPPLYVFYEGRNSLVYYYPDDFKERFVLLKVKGIRMFSKLKDGAIASIESNEMSQVDLDSYRNKKIPINLKRQPVKPKNKKELASVTGLKED